MEMKLNEMLHVKKVAPIKREYCDIYYLEWDKAFVEVEVKDKKINLKIRPLNGFNQVLNNVKCIPGHYHEKKDEVFFIREGALELKVEHALSDGYKKRHPEVSPPKAKGIVNEGDLISIPKMYAHTFDSLEKSSMVVGSPQNLEEVKDDFVKYDFKW